MYFAPPVPSLSIMPGPLPQIKQTMPYPAQVSLTDALNLPSIQYVQQKSSPVPFNPIASNGGKFMSFEEAMKFVYFHCIRNHGEYNKTLAKRYIAYCDIYDQANGTFESGKHVGRRDFDAEFRRITELSNIN